MTISTTASSVTLAGNGATTSFNFSFIAGAASNIVVVFTDASGNQTTLLQGSQYILALNAAEPGQIWGVGGTVTYPLSGAPIPSGALLTIQRIVPLTQTTSISNQGAFYPQAVERALDILCMEIQQVGGIANRALLFNPIDVGPFAPLPAAAQRASQLLGFDSLGNPIAAEPTGALVSSVMQPVVEAASTVEALALLGAPVSFSNIGVLRSFFGLLAPSLVWVDGYYANADGGEGMFVLLPSDTTSADNGGTIIVDTLGRRWSRETQGFPFSVKWFGAKGDGSTDDTTAIQACFTAAQTKARAAYFPGSTTTYRVSAALTISAPLEVFGDYQNSQIESSSPTANIINISSSLVHLHDLTMTASVTRSGGSYVSILAGGQTKITRMYFLNHFNAVTVGAGFSAIFDLSDCSFGECQSHGNGITILAGDDISIRHTVMNSSHSPQPDSGINIVNSGDVVLEDLNIIQHDRDLLINPGAGQEVDSVYATDCFFDTSSSYGLLVQPNGGSAQRCRFIGCWFSSHGSSGVLCTGSTGNLLGMEFIDCHAFANGGDGFTFNYGSGFTMIGCQAAGNSGAGATFGPGISKFTLVGNTLGPSGGFGGNLDGIFIGAGGGDQFIIADNRLQGNASSSLLNGASGTNVITTPNLV